MSTASPPSSSPSDGINTSTAHAAIKPLPSQSPSPSHSHSTLSSPESEVKPTPTKTEDQPASAGKDGDKKESTSETAARLGFSFDASFPSDDGDDDGDGGNEDEEEEEEEEECTPPPTNTIVTATSSSSMIKPSTLRTLDFNQPTPTTPLTTSLISPSSKTTKDLQQLQQPHHENHFPTPPQSKQDPTHFKFSRDDREREREHEGEGEGKTKKEVGLSFHVRSWSGVKEFNSVTGVVSRLDVDGDGDGDGENGGGGGKVLNFDFTRGEGDGDGGDYDDEGDEDDDGDYDKGDDKNNAGIETTGNNMESVGYPFNYDEVEDVNSDGEKEGDESDDDDHDDDDDEYNNNASNFDNDDDYYDNDGEDIVVDDGGFNEGDGDEDYNRTDDDDDDGDGDGMNNDTENILNPPPTSASNRNHAQQRERRDDELGGSVVMIPKGRKGVIRAIRELPSTSTAVDQGRERKNTRDEQHEGSSINAPREPENDNNNGNGNDNEEASMNTNSNANADTNTNNNNNASKKHKAYLLKIQASNLAIKQQHQTTLEKTNEKHEKRKNKLNKRVSERRVKNGGVMGVMGVSGFEMSDTVLSLERRIVRVKVDEITPDEQVKIDADNYNRLKNLRALSKIRLKVEVRKILVDRREREREEVGRVEREVRRKRRVKEGAIRGILERRGEKGEEGKEEEEEKEKEKAPTTTPRNKSVLESQDDGAGTPSLKRDSQKLTALQSSPPTTADASSSASTSTAPAAVAGSGVNAVKRRRAVTLNSGAAPSSASAEEIERRKAAMAAQAAMLERQKAELGKMKEKREKVRREVEGKRRREVNRKRILRAKYGRKGGEVEDVEEEEEEDSEDGGDDEDQPPSPKKAARVSKPARIIQDAKEDDDDDDEGSSSSPSSDDDNDNDDTSSSSASSKSKTKKKPAPPKSVTIKNSSGKIVKILTTSDLKTLHTRLSQRQKSTPSPTYRDYADYKKKNNLSPTCKVFSMTGWYPCVKEDLELRGWHFNPDRESPFFDMKWTLRSSDINTTTFRPEQLTNHFQKNTCITTKSGLQTSLKQSRFINDVSEDSFFPRCYDLSCKGEVGDFVGDFGELRAVGVLVGVLGRAKKAGFDLGGLDGWDGGTSANANAVNANANAERTAVPVPVPVNDCILKILLSVLHKRTSTHTMNDLYIDSNTNPHLEVMTDIESEIVMHPDIEQLVWRAVRVGGDGGDGGEEGEGREFDCDVLPVPVDHFLREDRERERERERGTAADTKMKTTPKSTTHSHNPRILARKLQQRKAYAQGLTQVRNLTQSDVNSILAALKSLRLTQTPEQTSINGDKPSNLWIVKPAGKSRGRGIATFNDLRKILDYTDCRKTHSTFGGNSKSAGNQWIVQKYIENPLVVARRKFDIRQWVLVTCWNPLKVWFYGDCYLRFAVNAYEEEGEEGAEDDDEKKTGKGKMKKKKKKKTDEWLDDPYIHLVNNSISKNNKKFHKNYNAEDGVEIVDNMWEVDKFKAWIKHKHGAERQEEGGQGHQEEEEEEEEDLWTTSILPSMHQIVLHSLTTAIPHVEHRANSWELYGFDFMFDSTFKPWLIEINSSPACDYSTEVTERFVKRALPDILKVTLDYAEWERESVKGSASSSSSSPMPSTGGWGCIHTGVEVPRAVAAYGLTLEVNGLGCKIRRGGGGVGVGGGGGESGEDGKGEAIVEEDDDDADGDEEVTEEAGDDDDDDDENETSKNDSDYSTDDGNTNSKHLKVTALPRVALQVGNKTNKHSSSSSSLEAAASVSASIAKVRTGTISKKGKGIEGGEKEQRMVKDEEVLVFDDSDLDDDEDGKEGKGDADVASMISTGNEDERGGDYGDNVNVNVNGKERISKSMSSSSSSSKENNVGFSYPQHHHQQQQQQQVILRKEQMQMQGKSLSMNGKQNLSLKTVNFDVDLLFGNHTIKK